MQLKEKLSTSLKASLSKEMLQLFPRTVNSCTFDSVTPNEFETIVKTFGSKKGNVDKIQLSILNLVILIISSFLSFVFNRFVEEGVYPDVFKMTHLVQIHESGKKNIMFLITGLLQRSVFLIKIMKN